MSPAHLPRFWRRDPTRAELGAIEATWPVIAAEVALVDAEAQAVLIPSDDSEAALVSAIASVAVATRRAGRLGGLCPAPRPLPLLIRDLKEVR